MAAAGAGAAKGLGKQGVSAQQLEMDAAAQRKMVLDSQAEVQGEKITWHSPFRHQLEQLNQYGVGLRLYFDFLQSMALMFAFLGIVGLPMTLGCYAGRNPRIESFLARLSIGNLGDCGAKGELCDLPEPMFVLTPS